MLRVKVELVPGGVEERARTLDTYYIGNLTHLEDTSDYGIWVDRDPRLNRIDPDFMVKDHVRSDGFVPLVARIFETLAGMQAVGRKLRHGGS